MNELLALVPPPEFDPMIVGVREQPAVVELARPDLESICAPAFDPRTEKIWACIDLTPGAQPVIFIDRQLRMEDRALVMRHELAHINGWRHE